MTSQEQTTNKKRKQILGTVVALVVLIIGAAGLFFWNRSEKAGGSSGVESTEDAKEDTIEKTTLTLNGTKYQMDYKVKAYLIMGTDASGNEDAEGEEYVGSMADFIQVLIIDERKETCGILTLNRDTITTVPLMNPDGTANATAELQLCTAHWYGGDKEMSCKNTVRTVKKMLGGLPISGYYALSMDAIGTLNHAVGGVEVTLEDDFSEMDPAMTVGTTLTLTDEQAVYFTRSRMNVGDGENTSRMRRQKVYMNALAAKAKTLAAEDSKFMNRLIRELDAYATTDRSVGQLTKIASQMQSYTDLGTFTPEGETALGQRLGDGLDHTEFYMDEASLEECMKELLPLSQQ